MTSFLFICHLSVFCSMFLFLPLCPIVASISIVLSFYFLFYLFLVFFSVVVDDFVTNRWQNGEVVS